MIYIEHHEKYPCDTLHHNSYCWFSVRSYTHRFPSPPPHFLRPFQQNQKCNFVSKLLTASMQKNPPQSCINRAHIPHCCRKNHVGHCISQDLFLLRGWTVTIPAACTIIMMMRRMKLNKWRNLFLFKIKSRQGSASFPNLSNPLTLLAFYFEHGCDYDQQLTQIDKSKWPKLILSVS